MKKATNYKKGMVRVVCALALFLCIGAADDEKDWSSARRRDDVAGYDDYVKSNPRGAHLDQAKQLAGERSKGRLRSSAGRCDPLYPRMVFYVVTAAANPPVAESELAAAFADSADCRLSGSLAYDDEVASVDGMFEARSRLVMISETRLPPRAMVDYDYLLYGLEYKLIKNTNDKIVKCKDQSAWVDTPPQEAMKCAMPYLQRNTRLMEGVVEQARMDFDKVCRVEDNDYRIAFWKNVETRARDDIMEYIAIQNQLHTDAMKVLPNEKDPKVAEQIEKTAIRLGGGGKPRGGSGLFP